MVQSVFIFFHLVTIVWQYLPNAPYVLTSRNVSNDVFIICLDESKFCTIGTLKYAMSAPKHRFISCLSLAVDTVICAQQLTSYSFHNTHLSSNNTWWAFFEYGLAVRTYNGSKCRISYKLIDMIHICSSKTKEQHTPRFRWACSCLFFLLYLPDLPLDSISLAGKHPGQTGIIKTCYAWNYCQPVQKR